jgi:hypothetical protein
MEKFREKSKSVFTKNLLAIGILGAACLVTGCSGGPSAQEIATELAKIQADTATAQMAGGETRTLTATETLTLTAELPAAKPIETPTPTAEPKAETIDTATPTNWEITGDLFAARGIPSLVDVKNVDVAKENTIGKGTEAWFADRGKLLVGPDFPQETIDKAGGAIELFNPLNQTVFENKGPSYFNLPEGGFVLASGNVMRVKIGDTVIKLEGAPGHNWMLVVRGRYSDGKPDSDLNIQMEFDKYIPGHIMVMRYPGKPNGGFISEEQFKQIAQTSHTEGTNCGADGCSGLSVFMYDVNTGAAAVIKQFGANGPWQPVWANFATRK